MTLKSTKQITMCYIQHELYLYLSFILLRQFGWYKSVNMINKCKVLHTNKNKTCVWNITFRKSYEIEHWHKQNNYLSLNHLWYHQFSTEKDICPKVNGIFLSRSSLICLCTLRNLVVIFDEHGENRSNTV